MKATNLSVVVLAAGLGTRMKSKQAKVLHRAGGLSLAEHVVSAASGLAAPERITVVTGHQADQVEASLAPLGVRFIRQTEQRGTGHALLACREALKSEGGELMVLYGDTPLLTGSTLRRLIDWHRERKAAATLIATTLQDPTGYGRVVLDASGFVQEIVEEKAADPGQRAIRLINSGIYLFNAPLLWKHILEIKPDSPAREYYLTDIVTILNRAGQRVDSLEIEDPAELLGINTRVELAAADRVLRDRKTRELMLSGVTIQRPETVTIDPRVTVGADTVIEPCAHLLGETAVGEDCHIGAGSVIENARLEDRVHVLPMTMIEGAAVRADSRVGPFSRLRPQADVGPGAHVGNFVEIKKTRLGEGSKANHLAYLGDSEIGDRVNIGAGTITCNFDGEHKHVTRIAEGAFVGSNSTLVAPVDVGEGSYIAAGSVVTGDVPAHALALGRARQVVKENWAEEKKS